MKEEKQLQKIVRCYAKKIIEENQGNNFDIQQVVVYTWGSSREMSASIKNYKGNMAKTSKRAGRAASKVLSNRNTSKNSKTAAASALRQRRDKK
jgi:microcystin degradation protein MlrC